MTTKQKKTLKHKQQNKNNKSHTHKVCRLPQKCGKRHCGECNVALWIGFGFVPSSCLPKILSFQVLAFQVLAFQVLVFVSSVCSTNIRKNTQEHARTRKNMQEHGTKIPQLDLTFPPKEFTEYGLAQLLAQPMLMAWRTLRLDMMTSSCNTKRKTSYSASRPGRFRQEAKPSSL